LQNISCLLKKKNLTYFAKALINQDGFHGDEFMQETVDIPGTTLLRSLIAKWGHDDRGGGDSKM
jgi:hypothetical protein